MFRVKMGQGLGVRGLGSKGSDCRVKDVKV